ncbi:hypothetical protein [Novosphingobium sp. KA1]|uniref:hypothetical protein n=1 Tax=Novosphingobium sp. (strain KA1) TaxID=164608 RepID=UPI001A8C56DA|nr:hypothetical protein [Novosphingobium sp. KA1]
MDEADGEKFPESAAHALFICKLYLSGVMMTLPGRVPGLSRKRTIRPLDRALSRLAPPETTDASKQRMDKGT